MKDKRKWLLVFILVAVMIAISQIPAWRFGVRTSEAGDRFASLPEPQAAVKIEIDTEGAPLPASRNEPALPVGLRLSVGGKALKTYGEIKIQGSSTARWPKKNWSLKFYEDKERTKELKVKIGNSVASDCWIAKAEWIDPTMLRNGLAYRLWESIVKSRQGLPQYEVDNALLADSKPTGAQGFPKSHPAVIEVNGEFYGLSMLLLGHDPQNFNIDAANPQHVYLEFDTRVASEEVLAWERFSAEGIGRWVNGYHPDNEDFTKEQKAAIDALSRLINGSEDNFVEGFSQGLDRVNMVDMLLFLEAVYDWDAVSQDIEMVTYDLEKWYLLPWDKDTTFGMWWDGQGLIAGSETTLLFDYEEELPLQRPWYRTYRAFKPQVEARYAELRKAGVFSGEGLKSLVDELMAKFPAELWEAEREKWAAHERPSVDETSPEQILEWFELRLEMLDEHFSYAG